MPHTGHICDTSGIYGIRNHNSSHPMEITMVKGNTFPPCYHCGERVEYYLKRITQH